MEPLIVYFILHVMCGVIAAAVWVNIWLENIAMGSGGFWGMALTAAILLISGPIGLGVVIDMKNTE